MQLNYMLDFTIGHLQCQLSTISPDHTHSRDQIYYRHRHPVYELHYAVQGRCSFRVADEHYDFSAGQAILIAPTAYHSIKTVSDDGVMVGIGFDLRPGDRADCSQEELALASVFKFPTAMILDIGAPDGPSAIAPLLLHLRALARQGRRNFVAREELMANTAVLILELSKKLPQHQPDRGNATSLASSQRDFLIDEFFNHNFQLSDGNQLLAQQLCISSRQLDRILHELYGMSYREKLQESRLEVSMDLLLTTDKSIAEISELVGYSSPANFSTFIKNISGQTPSEIRAHNR